MSEERSTAADFERFAAYCRRRGFRRVVAAALGIIGLAPAFIATAVRRPGYEDAWLIGGLIVFGPGALLFVWTYFDHAGQAARELVMWLRSVERAWHDPEVKLPLDQLPPVPADPGRISLTETAIQYRDALSPLVANPRPLAMRIGVYRFWYPILMVGLLGIGVLGFLAFIALTQ